MDHALSDPAVTLLVLSPFGEDQAALEDLLTGFRGCWHIRRTGSVPEALEILRRNQIPILVCESELPDGNWQDVLRQAADLAHPPQMIVMSRLADDRLWTEVLDLSGYDVLRKPFHPPEARRVIARAWEHWLHGGRARAAGA